VSILSRLLGRDRKPRQADTASARPSPGDPPVGRKDRERRAGEAINLLVNDFLEERRQRRRSGRLSLQNVDVTLNYPNASRRTFVSLPGKTGWVFRMRGHFVLVVSNDGHWAFAGKFQYRVSEGRDYRFVLESYSANGSPDSVWFEGFDRFYDDRLSDDGYSNPEAIVRAFEQAIAYWKTPRSPRPTPR